MLHKWAADFFSTLTVKNAAIQQQDVAATSLSTPQQPRSYISNETPTTSRWNVAKTYQWYVSTKSSWNVVTTSKEDVTTASRQYVSTTSQANLNETPKDVSVVRIHDVSLVRLYDVPCKSQMKQPVTPLWYISATSSSYVVAMPC